jgi:hypothetical protein
MWRVVCVIITPSSFSGYALIKYLANIYERSYIETEYDVTMGGNIANLKAGADTFLGRIPPYRLVALAQKHFYWLLILPITNHKALFRYQNWWNPTVANVRQATTSTSAGA